MEKYNKMIEALGNNRAEPLGNNKEVCLWVNSHPPKGRGLFATILN